MFRETVITVQRLSVSAAVFTVTERRNNIIPQKTTNRCRAVVKMMINEIKDDITTLSRNSDRYRLKRMQLALYVLLSQALSIEGSNERYKELKVSFIFTNSFHFFRICCRSIQWILLSGSFSTRQK